MWFVFSWDLEMVNRFEPMVIWYSNMRLPFLNSIYNFVDCQNNIKISNPCIFPSTNEYWTIHIALSISKTSALTTPTLEPLMRMCVRAYKARNVAATSGRSSPIHTRITSRSCSTTTKTRTERQQRGHAASLCRRLHRLSVSAPACVCECAAARGWSLSCHVKCQ